MNHPLLFLADVEVSEMLSAPSQFVNSGGMRNLLIITGSLLLVITIAAVGVYFSHKNSKKRRRHRHQHHDRSHHQPAPAESTVSVKTDNSSATHEHKSRRRRRRRSQRPMNPTLAQTGGLPPIRDSNRSLLP